MVPPSAKPSASPADGAEVAASTPNESGEALVDAVSALRSRFDEHIAANDLQRRAFDTLHADLQGYKNSFLLNELQKPVVRNLIQLYDSFLRLEEALPAVGRREAGPTVEEFTARAGDFVSNMESFRVELVEVLARLDVESYADRHDALEAERLRTLDRKLHRPVAVAETADEARHNAVVRVHKQGFYWRDRVFRPAEVTTTPASGGAGIMRRRRRWVR